MTAVETGITWHNDGHVIVLELNRAEIKVTQVICPGEGACEHPVHGCVVSWFLTRFGLECNVGVCSPTPEVTVAWSFSGDFNDLDAGQVWVIPTTDQAFAAWLVTQQPQSP